jgi:hypothetical protein
MKRLGIESLRELDDLMLEYLTRPSRESASWGELAELQSLTLVVSSGWKKRLIGTHRRSCNSREADNRLASRSATFSTHSASVINFLD